MAINSFLSLFSFFHCYMLIEHDKFFCCVHSFIYNMRSHFIVADHLAHIFKGKYWTWVSFVCCFCCEYIFLAFYIVKCQLFQVEDWWSFVGIYLWSWMACWRKIMKIILSNSLSTTQMRCNTCVNPHNL